MIGALQMATKSDPSIESFFPNLKNTSYKVTSPFDISYNCIAWAAGDIRRIWWPIDNFWPPSVPRETTIDAFLRAFESIGYESCENEDYEKGFIKITLYAKGTDPKHAARQINPGVWTSKLGKEVDISHELYSLIGDVYGDPVAFMKRPGNISDD